MIGVHSVRWLIFVAVIARPVASLAQLPEPSTPPPPTVAPPSAVPPSVVPPQTAETTPTDEDEREAVIESHNGAASNETATPAQHETTLEIYGSMMLDTGFDFGKIGDPNWQDVLRPTKLPAFQDEFGTGPRTFLGVRQTRFGVTTTLPTDCGDVATKLEWDLFGVGVDAGQTTFRMRHAYVTWRRVLAGQTWSPFMDPEVFPDSITHWGPNGMVFFRNVQLAYTPYERGPTHVTIALERPGASPDAGSYAGRVELESVVTRFPAPDVSAHVRYGGSWGHVQAAGIFRYITWDDVGTAPTVVEGHAYGWGANLSAHLTLEPIVLKLQAVYGRAIENYMNDAGFDIGPAPSNDARMPIDGVALPVFGLVAFADFNWSTLFTSTAGYSFVWIDNSEGQLPSAFHTGHYALANILLHPLEELYFGPEFQWDRRTNHSDGWRVNDYRIQFSIKYSFSQRIQGKR